MTQGSPGWEGTSTHGPVRADQLALELASRRIEYLAKLVLAALTKDPYLRPPVVDDWTWSQVRPLIQEAVDRKLTADGAAARRWAEVSEAVSNAIDQTTGAEESAAQTRRLSDLGTDLMNVLHLVDEELG